MLARLISWLTGGAAPWAALAALLAAIAAAWLRRDAARDRDRKAAIEDHNHAQDIEDRVADARADPERLRAFDEAGYRD